MMNVNADDGGDNKAPTKLRFKEFPVVFRANSNSLLNPLFQPISIQTQNNQEPELTVSSLAKGE